MAIQQHTCWWRQHLVAWWEHRVELIVCQRSVSLVYLPLPAVSLELLWCHGHEMTWCWSCHGHCLLTNWSGWAWGQHGHRWGTMGSVWSQWGAWSLRGHARGHLVGGSLVPATATLACRGSGCVLDQVTTPSTVCARSLSPTTVVTRGLCNMGIKS